MPTPVSLPCVVLIAPAERLPALQQHVPAEPVEVLTFADSDPLKALETIVDRRPSVVALERTFAETPRGTALAARVKADPSLAHAEILIVAHDESDTLERLHRSGSTPPAAPASEAPAPRIDFKGTRRALRLRMAEHVKVMVDGHAATLVDLSVAGAQVVSAAVLRPNHRVRVVMADDRSSVRCVAQVAWASFEIPPKTEPRYRAGLQFLDANPADIEAYGERHRANE